ncbi:unnamed protein product, partial [Mesorhabditis belari]|uniref:Uncharacterized protein n=1 Tax=Mesorhabditis belari TaxID=2138241 RepID=A0AAF3FNT6_9BILA
MWLRIFIFTVLFNAVNAGIDQTYELGTFLRQRYVEGSQLFGPNFDKSKVFIQASDSERALESAQSVATALFPPIGNRVWNSNLLGNQFPSIRMELIARIRF